MRHFEINNYSSKYILFLCVHYREGGNLDYPYCIDYLLSLSFLVFCLLLCFFGGIGV
jgi:hypothetical protein